MKKLMIALSAAALAFGLRAADGFVGGSNFESDTAGTIQAGSITATGGAWSTTDEAATLTIATDGVFTDGTKRPAEWSKDANTQYLNVKTAFGKPLDFTLTAEQTIGEGVYFDSLVKFTACDEAPTFSDATAKLAVWIQENSDGTATNLYIRAGKFDGETWQAYNYDCGTAPGEGWHRLTIKSIANIYTTGSGSTAAPGFVVYIDGSGTTGDPVSTSTKTGVDTAKLTANAKGFDELGRLFPSIDQESIKKGTITSVGFEGQGQIDDVTITTTAPGFAKDNEYFTVVMGSNVTGFKYSLSGAAAVSASATVQLPYVAGMTVAISDVTCADGYMYNNLTIGGTPVGSNTFEPASKDLTGSINAKAAGAQVDIGGVKTPYATVADALTALNGVQSETTATLKLFGAVSGSVVINNANLTLTIDLAGQTITGTAPAVESENDAAIYVNAGSVTIIDSSDPSTGKVVKGAASAAIDANENGTVAAISGGTFDGMVCPTIGLISGGKFSYADNNNEGACSISATLPEGKMFVKDNVETPTYWVLGNWKPAGTGTAEDPYQIDSVQALTWVQTQVAGGNTFAGKFLEQTADITLADGFTGIGTYAEATAGTTFAGTYDGGNFTVNTGKFAQRNYGGLFNQVTGTIKNLTINLNGFVDGLTGEYGGAAIGHLFEGGMLTNVTATGSMSGTHNVAGVLVRMAPNTVVVDCVNAASVSGAYTKIGGVVCLTQKKSSATGLANPLIKNCRNEGVVSSIAGTNAGRDGVGGILGYVCVATDIESCSNTGAITKGTGAHSNNRYGTIVGWAYSGAVSASGTITAQADKVTVGDIETASPVANLKFATVDGNVATLVADGALTAGGSYKVMAKGGSPVVTLAAGESITFDTTLVALTSDAGITTSAAGYEVTSAAGVYTATAKTLNITYVYTTNGVAVAAAELTGLSNTERTTFTVTDNVTFDTSKITLTDFTLKSIVPASWNAGDKTADVEVTVAFEKAAPTGPSSEQGSITEPDPSTGRVVFTPTDASTTTATINLNGFTGGVEVPGTITTIIGVPASQLKVMVNGYEVDNKYFVGGDEKGFDTTLSDAAKPVIGEVTVGEEPVAPVSSDNSVGITTVAGLKYTLIAGDEPNAVETAATEATLATGTALKLTADPAKFTPTGAKAFFKVEVSK